MSLPLFLQGLGSVGVFASRAFLPAFVTALLLRFGPHAPWLAHAGLLPQVRGVPTWFTSDAALVVLGLLAALELVRRAVPRGPDGINYAAYRTAQPAAGPGEVRSGPHPCPPEEPGRAAGSLR